MTVQTLSATEAAQSLHTFDTVVDARSPAEFAQDHLPSAVNWPTLDNDERQAVGTEYKQVSAFDARKHGAAMVARRIADHIETHLVDKPKAWRPLVYCWRGGKRSGTLAWFLDQIGFRTHVIEGGYKAFREAVRDGLNRLPGQLAFTVIAGKTGSGKTRLLHALEQQGAQVLHLEGLAQHRGSILGGLPAQAQPTQKSFEMQLWSALRAFDPSKQVFVESESRKIGARQVPDALLNRMRQHGQCVVLNVPDSARVNLLLQDYNFYTQDPALFNQHIEALVPFRGRDTVAQWQAMARQGQFGEVFLALMQQHYDPLYLRSIERNFDLQAARELMLQDADETSMQRAAASLLLPSPPTPRTTTTP